MYSTSKSSTRTPRFFYRWWWTFRTLGYDTMSTGKCCHHFGGSKHSAPHPSTPQQPRDTTEQVVAEVMNKNTTSVLPRSHNRYATILSGLCKVLGIWVAVDEIWKRTSQYVMVTQFSAILYTRFICFGRLFSKYSIMLLLFWFSVFFCKTKNEHLYNKMTFH